MRRRMVSYYKHNQSIYLQKFCYSTLPCRIILVLILAMLMHQYDGYTSSFFSFYQFLMRYAEQNTMENYYSLSLSLFNFLSRSLFILFANAIALFHSKTLNRYKLQLYSNRKLNRYVNDVGSIFFPSFLLWLHTKVFIDITNFKIDIGKLKLRMRNACNLDLWPI